MDIVSKQTKPTLKSSLKTSQNKSDSDEIFTDASEGFVSNITKPYHVDINLFYKQ